MNGKRMTEEKTRKNGFYLALSVCLVAVGIAAWSTYDAVNGYMEPAEEDSSLASQQAEEVRQGQETDASVEESTSSRESEPAVEVDPEDGENDDPEAPRDTSAQETAGEVTQEPEEAQESSEEEVSQPSSAQETEEEAQVPATAPLYEISQTMIYPLENGEVANAYSAGAPVYSETMKDWRIHTGLDLSAQSEQPVMACANGQVKETYSDSMLGNVVLVEHGDYLFYYCGLGENFLVEPGEVVSAGQQIGVVTAVPFEAAEEPHLHLEVRRDGVALDPQSVLDGTV